MKRYSKEEIVKIIKNIPKDQYIERNQFNDIYFNNALEVAFG